MIVQLIKRHQFVDKEKNMNSYFVVVIEKCTGQFSVLCLFEKIYQSVINRTKDKDFCTELKEFILTRYKSTHSVIEMYSIECNKFCHLIKK